MYGWTWLVLLSALLFGGSGSTAQTSPEAPEDWDVVVLSATYLAEPTEWCAAQEGVPVLFDLDGPNILRGPIEPQNFIISRRGTEEVVRIPAHTDRDPVAGDGATDVIGRLSAEFRACQTPWASAFGEGQWQIDGEVTLTGPLRGNLGVLGPLPFFQLDTGSGLYRAYVRVFGGQEMIAARETKFRKTVTYAYATGEEN